MGLLIQKFGNHYKWEHTDDDGSDPITLEDLEYIAWGWRDDLRIDALAKAEYEMDLDLKDANAYEDDCPHSDEGGRFGITTWQLDFCNTSSCNVFEKCQAKFKEDNPCPIDKGKFGRDIYKLPDCDFCKMFQTCLELYEYRRNRLKYSKQEASNARDL